MTTRDATSGELPEAWVNLRDEQGRIQARYCPQRQLLVIRERRVDTVHDLSRYGTVSALPIDETERAC